METTRRTLGVWGLAGTGAAGLGALGADRASAAGPDPAARRPIVVGANPGLQLFDRDDNPTAYVSCWQVDWSTHGAGEALVLWLPDEVSVYGTDRRLSLWLADYFVRNFPELEGQTWSTPRFRRCPVAVDLSLARGLRARAGDVSVVISGVQDRRAFATDEFPLAGVDHSLSMVLGPCAHGRVFRHGRPLPGEVHHSGTPERPSSSAFVTEAEVWRV